MPPDWEFNKNAENGMGITSLLAVALLLGRVVYSYVGKQVREILIEKLFSRAVRFGSTVRLSRLLTQMRVGLLKLLNLGVPYRASPVRKVKSFPLKVVASCSVVFRPKGAIKRAEVPSV